MSGVVIAARPSPPKPLQDARRRGEGGNGTLSPWGEGRVRGVETEARF